MLKGGSLSVCTIFKNEQEFLPEYLQSICPFADDLVLVDTGSQDASLEILQDRGVKFHSFEWVDDFSKAKNYALSKAQGDWVLFLDADERLLPQDFQILKKNLGDLQKDGYFLKVLSVRTREWKTSQRQLQSIQNHLRLFRNHQGYSYRYKIHEMIIESIENSGGKTANLDLCPIYHLGYCDDLMELKIKRNTPLIQRDYEEDPTDPRNILYYAHSIMSGDPKLLSLLAQGWRNSHKGFRQEILQTILEWFLDFEQPGGVDPETHPEIWEKRLLEIEPESAVAAIRKGRVAYKNSNLEEAALHYSLAHKHLEQFLHTKYHHEVLDRSVVLLAMQGKFKESRDCLGELKSVSGFTPGVYHQSLKLCFAMQEWPQFIEEIRKIPLNIHQLEENKKREILGFLSKLNFEGKGELEAWLTQKMAG